jgi:hypothetical protein
LRKKRSKTITEVSPSCIDFRDVNLSRPYANFPFASLQIPYERFIQGLRGA